MNGKKPTSRRSRSHCGTPRKRTRKVHSRRSLSIIRETPPLIPVDIGFTHLGVPIKSPNDPKDYKVIRLSNGLRAILISDLSCKEDHKRVARNPNCLDTRIEKFNKDVLGLGGEVDCCGQPVKSKPAKNQKVNKPEPVTEPPPPSRHIEGCECHRMTAGVTLSAGGGGFHDPKDIPGLAHLLEHVNFCGSGKYPGSTTFDAFLCENNGIESNGQTWGGETLFFFGIEQNKLSEALDMFISLMIDPTLTLEDIQNERDVVDAEFFGIEDNDVVRISRMFHTAGRKGHPVTNFFWGSGQTLRAPDGRDETLQEQLRQFRKTHYRADTMTLGIQAAEPIHLIQDLVVKYFGQLPKCLQELPDPFSKDILPYDTPEFRKFYSILSVSDQKRLQVAWELPIPRGGHYRTKPFDYLVRIIQHSTHGGLTQYLRSRNMVNHLECSCTAADWHHYDSHDISVLFVIIVYLTEATVGSAFQVIEAIYSYLKFLEQIGPQEWFFNELKSIQALQFHFLDDMEPVENSKRMAQNLRFYETRDTLIGELLPTEWAPETISTYLKLLTPYRANYMMLNRSFKDCELVEPYFKIKYKVDDICPHHVRRWETIEPYTEFKICGVNRFITTNFCHVTKESELTDEDSPNPTCIQKNERIELWNLIDLNMRSDPDSGYKMDSYTEYYVTLVSPIPLYTVQAATMLDVWVILLKFILNPSLFGALEAHLNYDIRKVAKGVEIRVSGFSQKLNVLTDEILSNIGSFTTSICQELFEVGKGWILRNLHNLVKAAEDLGAQLRYRICVHRYWTFLEQYNALDSVTYEEFQRFCEELTERMYAVGLVQGNVDPGTTLQFGNHILSMLNFQPLQPETMPEARGCQLPLGDTILRTRSINLSSTSSSVQVQFQVENTDVHTPLICKTLKDLIQGPAFNELRTKQNLGYIVNVNWYIGVSTSNLIILVNCQSDKFTVSEVKERIDAFVQSFYETTISNLSKTELRNAASTALSSGVSNAEQNFRDIMSGKGEFYDVEKEEKLFENITVAQVQDWYETYLLPGSGSQMRKLTTQVVGSLEVDPGEEILQSLVETAPRRKPKVTRDKFQLVVLVPPENRTNSQTRFIRSINEFKGGLPLYPISRNP